MPADYRIGRLNGRYVVSWWVDGIRRRHRLKALDAKSAEREAIDVVRREVIKAPQTTVGDLWEAYLAEKDGRRAAAAMLHEWKAVGPHFGHLRPDQITTDLCRAYTASRRKTTVRGKVTGVHDGTIWTELGRLRTVLRWALGERAPKIERPAKPAPKERFLTDKEILRLLDAPAPLHIKTAIHLMLSTGARVGAVLDLTWDRVDFDAGVVDFRLPDSSTRKGRAVVPMHPTLRAALQTARDAARTDHVIEWLDKPVANIKTGFYATVKAAGLSGISPHVLRHTAGVRMAAAGRPMSRISQYLGHSNTSITERVYARYAPDHLREEAASLDYGNLRSVGRSA
jgi:integrase